MASRYKAQVSFIEKPWGEAFTYEEIKYEIAVSYTHLRAHET